MKYDIISSGVAAVVAAMILGATVALTDDLWAWAAAWMGAAVIGGAIKIAVHDALTGDVGDVDDEDIEVVDLDE